jgi:hypothetical protein
MTGIPEWWFLGPSARERQSSPKEPVTSRDKSETEALRYTHCMACGKPKAAHTAEQLSDGCRQPAGRALEGVEIDQSARVQACRSCGKPIWWGKTAAGKACCFDVYGRERTAITHFSTCPDAKLWTKKR